MYVYLLVHTVRFGKNIESNIFKRRVRKCGLKTLPVRLIIRHGNQVKNAEKCLYMLFMCNVAWFGKNRSRRMTTSQVQKAGMKA